MTIESWVIHDLLEETFGIDPSINLYLVEAFVGMTNNRSHVVSVMLDKDAALSLKDQLNNWCIKNRTHTSNSGPYYGGSAYGAIACGLVIPGNLGTEISGVYTPYATLGMPITSSGVLPYVGNVICGSMYIPQADERVRLIHPHDPKFEWDRYCPGYRYEITETKLRS